MMHHLECDCESYRLQLFCLFHNVVTQWCAHRIVNVKMFHRIHGHMLTGQMLTPLSKYRTNAHEVI